MTLDDVMTPIQLEWSFENARATIEAYAVERVEEVRTTDSDLQETMRGLDAERTERKLFPTERIYSWEEMATHAAEQVAAETERCAGICDKGYTYSAGLCAAAIRARAQEEA